MSLITAYTVLSREIVSGCQKVHKIMRQKISVLKTNSFDDIEKIVHFGILSHVLS